ncbi:hypothetical protein GCM10009780_08080 [Actinomadura alba]
MSSTIADMKHYLPEPDDLIVAALHGAASRHAGWTAPEGSARQAAVTELREIAGGRTDLLAQVAGLLLGYAPPGDAMHEHNRIAAELLIDAGADPGAVRAWIEIGGERRANARARPFSRPLPPDERPG